MENMNVNYLVSAIKQLEYYKSLGEKAMSQLSDDQFGVKLNEESNSICSIVKHLWGNMMSRWTDFLTSDGEKEWREREAEFDNDLSDIVSVMLLWNQGWDCCLSALGSLNGDDLNKMIYIRNQGHTVLEAINRQLAHYSYHVGQIVFLAKAITIEPWQSLSIPRGGTEAFNSEKFAQEKKRRHFTDNK